MLHDYKEQTRTGCYKLAIRCSEDFNLLFIWDNSVQYTLDDESKALSLTSRRSWERQRRASHSVENK